MNSSNFSRSCSVSGRGFLLRRVKSMSVAMLDAVVCVVICVKGAHATMKLQSTRLLKGGGGDDRSDINQARTRFARWKKRYPLGLKVLSP